MNFSWAYCAANRGWKTITNRRGSVQIRGSCQNQEFSNPHNSFNIKDFWKILSFFFLKWVCSIIFLRHSTQLLVLRAFYKSKIFHGKNQNGKALCVRLLQCLRQALISGGAKYYRNDKKARISISGGSKLGKIAWIWKFQWGKCPPCPPVTQPLLLD